MKQIYLLSMLTMLALACTAALASDGDENLDIEYGADVACSGAMIEAGVGLGNAVSTSNVHGEWTVKASKDAAGSFSVESTLNGNSKTYNSATTLTSEIRSELYDTTIASINYLLQNKADTSVFCKLVETANSACAGQFKGVPRYVIEQECAKASN